MSQLASSPADAGRGGPGGRAPDPSPPVRSRSGRRPFPPLLFLLVLALAASAVWVYVLRSNGDPTPSSGTACASAAPAPSLAAGSVTVRVLNGTSKQGLATTVADDLRGRGLNVSEVGNDPTGRTVTGPGEIRHGGSAGGRQAAAYLRAYLPGAGDYQDTRATAVVDLVIGPAYDKLATPDQVQAALNGGSSC